MSLKVVTRLQVIHKHCSHLFEIFYGTTNLYHNHLRKTKTPLHLNLSQDNNKTYVFWVHEVKINLQQYCISLCTSPWSLTITVRMLQQNVQQIRITVLFKADAWNTFDRRGITVAVRLLDSGRAGGMRSCCGSCAQQKLSLGNIPIHKSFIRISK